MQATRKQIRLAQRIHNAYVQRDNQNTLLRQINWNDLEERFHKAQKRYQQFALAIERGWQHSVPEQRIYLHAAFQGIADSFQAAQEAVLSPPPSLPSLRDLLDEVRNLTVEFDDVVFEQNFLAVQTEPIELSEVALGRFAVRFFWERLTGPAADYFDVVALDPNPANGNNAVTHPHVKDEQLCTGDAKVPLQKAMNSGRLTDAFHLIRGVLETYNSQSAHVSLNDWNGAACNNCGRSVDEDNSCFCEGCNNGVCDECTSTCKHCDNTRCASCQSCCEDCDEPCCYGCSTEINEKLYCKDCTFVCMSCDDNVPGDDFDQETELCMGCREAKEAKEAKEAEDARAAAEAEANEEPSTVITP